MSEDTMEEEEMEEEHSSMDTSPLEMSDEDIMNMPEPTDETPAEAEETIQEGDDTSEEEKPEEDEQDTAETEEIDEDESDAEEEDESPDGDSSGGTGKETENDSGKQTEDSLDEKEDSKNGKEEEETTPAVNFEDEYKKLMSPFKANGKEMQVANVDDAITLMKMGANYNKKMAGLKPNLKLLKMLDKNGLLDEGKLAYLIDLDKKNPDAINKLIKDSGVDPLEVDIEKDSEYKPNTYTVDDKEVELDEVLDDIRETISFKDTIDVISNKWDEASKQILLDQPQIIKVINSHVENGIYDKITQVMEQERALGRLVGMSDIAAYRQIGDAIQAQGGFNEPAPQANKPVSSQSVKKASDPKLKNRKKAASSTKSAGRAKPSKQEFNPLSVSDEEFEKMAASQYM